jgi:hypothetical protein
MNAYDNASLIMYPSGYKASKIYSQKPTDGSGDLTFTRASSATRVNEQGLIESVAANIPRIDFTGGGCGKLLLEPQRTNLVTYSEDHTQTSTEACTTSGGILAPDGSMNAWKIVEDTTVDQHVCRVINSTQFSAGEVGTCSIHVKAAERTSARIWFHHITTNQFAYVEYNLITGAFIQSGDSGAVFVDSTIVAMDDGWWAVSITGYKNVSTYYWSPAVSPLDSNGDVTYLGDGVSGVYMWGGQTERGASYPTSYIPTSGTTVTRVKDESITLGMTSLIGQTEGTWQVKFTKDNIDTYRIMTLWGGGSSNRLLIYTQSNALRVACISGGVNQFEPTLLSAIGNGTFNVAFAYKDNDFEVYVNGVSVYTNTSASVPIALNDLLFGQTNGGGLEFNYEVDAVTLFKTRLTGTQLATLTT